MAAQRVLRGRWIVVDGTVVGDDTCALVREMVAQKLKRLAERDGGWRVLFWDPYEDVYWELTYPESDLHGGGPPELSELSAEQVAAAYPEASEAKRR